MQDISVFVLILFLIGFMFYILVEKRRSNIKLKNLRMKKRFSKTYLQDSWLTDGLNSKWITKTTVKTKAKCVSCQKEIDLSTMAVSALNSHAKGKTHLRKIEKNESCVAVNHFFKKSTQREGCSSSGSTSLSASSSISSPPPNKLPRTIDNFVVTDATTPKLKFSGPSML